jgi:NAD(P)H-dependent FMN reductase
MNIEIISGSPRSNSITHRAVLYLKKHLSEITAHNINIIDVRDWKINVLQQEVFRTAETAPEPLRPLARRMFEADAFILVTPEYNGSYTPALKNLFDHFPKQSHKVFGIANSFARCFRWYACRAAIANAYLRVIWYWFTAYAGNSNRR